MEHLPIDPVEMELRQNKDFIAILKMIGEGGPIYVQPEEMEKKRKEQEGFDEDELPFDYQ